MKTLYFDCGMGAAGDMLMASLYEICPDKEKFLKSMNEMGLPGLSIEAEPSVKCGITGTHMKVTIHGEEEESVDVDLQGHEHEHHQEHNHEDSQHSHAHDHHHDHEDTHHDHSHESHHHAHEMAESAAEQTVHECIYDKKAEQTTRIKTISITPTPMTTIIIADMIIPTIMVTPTTITPAWQVFPISSST